MRLLHFDALERLVSTDFSGKTLPPYAILSHRWSDSEVLFEDIASEAYKDKQEGYQKLEFCAKQAVQDNLQYFWIDTCCIDRWNLRERSKSINSMFQWYKNAEQCYVLLSDVSLSAATTTSQRSHWEASFRSSSWFTRGWTLQELIAPVSVSFFSCEGRRIGDRTSLDQLIHEITDIPLAALHNCPMDQFTTLERQRWAQKRETTEEEDIVYCLLGVLGVSMPTTYGEGRNSAQRRLQIEIEAVGTAPSFIPFPRNHRFVGQESHVTRLEATLFSNKKTTSMLAIVGSCGTGKSQLALEVAYRTRQNNKHCSVFWIDASNKDSLYQSYANVAQKLGVSGWDNDKADTKQLARHCVEEISTRQCLLIYDNAESTTLQSSGSSTAEVAELPDYLPHSHLCSIIFTTSNSDTTRKLALQCVVALQELPSDAAQMMLQNHLARPLSNVEQKEADHLLKELSYLPLAVAQAAACMKTSGMTVQEYLSRLDKHTDITFDYSSNLCGSQLQGNGVRDPVATTLFLSIDQIGGESSFAVDCLFFTACMDRRDISLDLLKAASPQAREDAVRLLDKYALVTRRPAESALDLHRLVHQALRERLKVQGKLRKWARRAITQLLQVYPDENPSNRSKWRRLLPHAQYALSHSATDDNYEERLYLAGRCFMTLYSDGRYKEAEELELQVMQTTKRVLGDDHPCTLASMANLASTYSYQGRWDSAEQLQGQVIEGMKKVLSDDHPHTLTSINNLALTYWNQGRWNKAEQLQVQVIQRRKRVLGIEHPDTLASMANLAITHWGQGRLEDAEELQVEVMETTQRLFGKEHPDTLSSMADLASTYSDQGRWEEAKEIQEEVMEKRNRVLGNEHPHTLTSMANLASTYWNQGRWKEAEQLQVQVVEWRQRVLSNEHPDTLASMNNLASTYSDQGRCKEAEQLQVQVVEGMTRVLGSTHPRTLTSNSNLALTLQLQGRHKEAFALMEICSQLREQVLGEQHPDTQSSLNTLSNWSAECSNESV